MNTKNNKKADAFGEKNQNSKFLQVNSRDSQIQKRNYRYLRNSRSFQQRILSIFPLVTFL